MRAAAAGVRRIPPTDRPVDETESATARRRWNQRDTNVDVGTSAQAANPAPKSP